MNRGNFIVIEGFDGVGKTTLSKQIACNHGYEYIKCPEGIFSQVRVAFDNKNVIAEDRLSFYTGVAIRNSIKAESLLNRGVNVVMDRYYYSIIAYHYNTYLALNNQLQDLFKNLIQPDTVCCLELSYNLIQKRRKLSGSKIKPDDNIFNTMQLYRKITSIYHEILPNDTIYIKNFGLMAETESLLLNYIQSNQGQRSCLD